MLFNLSLFLHMEPCRRGKQEEWGDALAGRYAVRDAWAGTLDLSPDIN